MTKNKLSKYLLFLSFFTLLAIFFSVVQQSYNNLIQASAEVKSSPLIKSVSPDLDIQIIDEIENRQEFYQWEIKKYPLL